MPAASGLLAFLLVSQSSLWTSVSPQLISFSTTETIHYRTLHSRFLPSAGDVTENDKCLGISQGLSAVTVNAGRPCSAVTFDPHHVQVGGTGHLPHIHRHAPPAPGARLWVTQGISHLSRELLSSPQHLPSAGGAQAVTSSPTALFITWASLRLSISARKYDIILDSTDDMAVIFL